MQNDPFDEPTVFDGKQVHLVIWFDFDSGKWILEDPTQEANATELLLGRNVWDDNEETWLELDSNDSLLVSEVAYRDLVTFIEEANKRPF